MNPYLMSLPTVLAGLIVLFFAIRTIRLANRIEASSKADFERKMAELKQLHQEFETARTARQMAEPADLALELDLSDAHNLPDLSVATQQAQPLVSALSRQEQELGGAGLLLTAAKVEPGAVRLTLSPVERTGSAERVRRIADELNANGGQLPPGVTAAHADILTV